MKVTDRIHAIKHPFRLAAGEGQYVDRFVYSYILLGEKVYLIDAGVAGTASLLRDSLKELGRSPEEISMVLLTHAHPDHIGGCLAIKKISSASFAAHGADKPWIEDVERQYRERPILNFFQLVGGSVPVTQELKEGQIIHLDYGKTLRVIETPGHSPGSVSFFDGEDGILFTGDTVPAAGTIPIYVDPKACIQSIKKLQKIQGVKHLLSSWHDPITGDQVSATMEEAIRYVERIDEIVKDLTTTLPKASSSEELTFRALERLGLPAKKVPFMVMAAFEAHRKN
jgi:hydroxyacylglutathione hydrolase